MQKTNRATTAILLPRNLLLPAPTKITFSKHVSSPDVGVPWWLEKLWLLDETTLRLCLEVLLNPAIWVGHETIYPSHHVRERVELLRELARCVRLGLV